MKMELKKKVKQIFYTIKSKKTIKNKNISIAHAVELNLDNCELGEYVNIAHHAQLSNAKVGNYTSIGRYTKIQYASIGKFCSISWDCTIGALGHNMHAVSTHAFPYRKQFDFCQSDLYLNHKSVEIGNDVWIGCGVIIMPGIKIGNGAVIGAGSVVTKNVEEYEVVAGVPSRHLSWRFDDAIIKEMKKCEWWNLPIDVIKDNLEVFDINIDINDNQSTIERLKKLCSVD